MRRMLVGALITACLACYGQEVDYVEGVFALYDANSDHTISLAELEAVHRALELAVDQAQDAEAHARLRKKFSPLLDIETWLRADRNDDQMLSTGELAEFLWLRDFHEDPPPSLRDCRYLAQLEVREVFEPLLEMLDADGDARLTSAEAGEALKGATGLTFKQIDTDKNQAIDRAEFEAYSYRQLLQVYALDEGSEGGPD